jgi:hypothetical protein
MTHVPTAPAATAETDPSLRRIQRDSGILCAAAAAAALVLERGRPDGALGVVAGAALMAFSYHAIKGGVTAIVRKAAATGQPGSGGAVSRGRLVWTLVKFIGRYVVIGVAAWTVLVPLRAHPLGLFAGVSVPVAAIGIEALRLLRAPSGPRGPEA